MSIYPTNFENRVILEELIISPLVKKFPAFYGIQRHIPVFTRPRLLTIPCAGLIQFRPYIFKVHY
jgi:hypothetical protein